MHSRRQPQLDRCTQPARADRPASLNKHGFCTTAAGSMRLQDWERPGPAGSAGPDDSFKTETEVRSPSLCPQQLHIQHILLYCWYISLLVEKYFKFKRNVWRFMKLNLKSNKIYSEYCICLHHDANSADMFRDGRMWDVMESRWFFIFLALEMLCHDKTHTGEERRALTGREARNNSDFRGTTWRRAGGEEEEMKVLHTLSSFQEGSEALLKPPWASHFRSEGAPLNF